MKNLKIFLAMLLALTMVVSMAACGGNNAGKETDSKGTDAPAGNDDTTAAADDTTAAPGEDMSWLNLGGVYPIVSEGTEKTLTICMPIADELYEGFEERWQYVMTEEVLNINLEFQAVTSSAWSEKLPLILADTENLPDIFMNTGWTTTDLLRYGSQEGLLLDIAPYITEEYMPCLASLFTDHPEMKTAWTDADGHVWGVTLLSAVNGPDAMQWHYLNYQWMVDCGLNPETDLPETLDEFTDLMRLFKEKKSAELGKEIYPISGKYTGWNSVYKYLLAACGFVGSNNTSDFPGGDINTRNGKVTLPVADREGYTLFLETMKLWYDEGLIHPEFITGDGGAIDALISAGETGFVTVPPFIWVGQEVEKLGQWWGAPLLTSSACENPQVPSAGAGTGCPQHVITTACEEVELALAFFDFFYQRAENTATQNAFWTGFGLFEESALAEQYPEFAFTKMDGVCGYAIEVDTDKYVDANDQLNKINNLWGHGAIGYLAVEIDGVPQLQYTPDLLELTAKYDGKGVASYVELTTEERGTAFNIQNVAPRAFTVDHIAPANEEFPTTVYFDAETTELKNDLFVTLKEFATTEAAKFITGERDLAELPAYFDEIDTLGAQEYIKIHQDYFDAIHG